MAESADKKAEGSGKQHRWIWRGTKNKQPADPSQPPLTAAEHKRRLENTEWGPFVARLCPVEVLSGGPEGNMKCKDLASQDVFDVPFHESLPWYEGLLALDTMKKCNLRPNWFNAYLESVLNSNRQKQTNKEFNAIQYVRLKLKTTAATGPSFTDSAGHEHKHRRQLKSKLSKPTQGETTSTHFACHGIKGYLPPWEAMLHKSCGLYQDYYLVHWEDETSIKPNVESSSHLAGCSWEPDECVPDDMDAIRIEAKEEWLKEERTLDPSMIFDIPLSAKRFYEESQESLNKKMKIMKMTANPNGQPINCDFHNPFTKHGWKEKPPSDDRQRDEANIKKGWPKSAAEYPAGYGPANPPGFCREDCDCMEDWHLGKKELEDREQDKPANKFRATHGQASLDNLAACGLVNKRGSVSNQCYFEVIQLQPFSASKFRSDAGQLRSLIFSTMEEFPGKIPIHAFMRDENDSLCKTLIRALVFFHLQGGLLPSRYDFDSKPTWLSIEPSGELHVTAEPPELREGTTQSIVVKLTFDNIPKEVLRQEMTIKVGNFAKDREKELQLMQKMTLPITRAMQDMKLMPRLRRCLEQRLSPAVDFSKAGGTLREPSLGIWLQAMYEAAQVAQTCSTCHV